MATVEEVPPVTNREGELNDDVLPNLWRVFTNTPSGIWSLITSLPGLLWDAIWATPGLLWDVLTNAPRFLAKEYGGMAGKLSALGAFIYFSATVGARLFSKSVIIRPIVSALLLAAFPEAVLARHFIALVVSPEFIGFAMQAATIFDKGIIGDNYKMRGKDFGKDAVRDWSKKYLGVDPKAPNPAHRWGWQGWKQTFASRAMDAGGLVGGL